MFSCNRAAVRTREGGGMLVAMAMMVAVALIFSVALGVVAARELNRQREVESRSRLEAAFRGTFPFPSPPSTHWPRNERANLWRDITYQPVPPTTKLIASDLTNSWDLRALVNASAVGVSDPTHATWTVNPIIFGVNAVLQPGSRDLGAWNGPYWNRSLDASGRPADAWGRPLRLRYISTGANPGWQVFSVGANGADNTGNASPPLGDDLAFPIPPYTIPTKPVIPPASCTFTIGTDIQFDWNRKGSEIVTITFTYPTGSVSTTGRFNNGHPEGINWTLTSLSLPVGSVTMSFAGDYPRADIVITVNANCTLTIPGGNPISL